MELNKKLVSGEQKSLSQSNPPSLSTSDSQNKIEWRITIPSSTDKEPNLLRSSSRFEDTVLAKLLFI